MDLAEDHMPDDGHSTIDRGGTGTLPKPTGHFSVGRIGCEVLDPARTEIYSQAAGDKRESGDLDLVPRRRTARQ
jgi:hypothetical protein